MRFNQRLTAVGILWGISLVFGIVFQGLLNAIINPFIYWIAFMETVEFLMFIPTNLDMLPILFSLPISPEVVSIWIGLPAFFGWIIGLATVFQSERDSRYVIGGIGIFLFNPVLAILGTRYIQGKNP